MRTTGQIRDWLMLWKVRGGGTDLPLRMLVTVPWRAFAILHTERKLFVFGPEQAGRHLSIPKGSRPGFQWTGPDGDAHGIEAAAVDWREDGPHWDDAHYTFWYERDSHTKRDYPMGVYTLEAARRHVYEATLPSWRLVI